MKRPIQQYEQFIRNGTISPKNKPKGPALKLMLPLQNTKLFLKTWNKTASKKSKLKIFLVHLSNDRH
jgi:hypothetical protein